jgi:hypothetical protein
MERTQLVELHNLGLSRRSLFCLPMNAMHPIGGSYQAVTARRAKRENGGLGEDPPGSTMTYKQVLRTWMLSQGVKELYR